MMVVKLYEKLTGTQAVVGDDPFTDTDSPDILKAYNLKKYIRNFRNHL